MVFFIRSFAYRSLPIRTPFQMHIVEEDESATTGCEITFEFGDDDFVDGFVLCVALWVDSFVGFFAVFIEAEGLWS